MGWVDARIGQALGNDRYQGMAFGWIFLVLVGVMNLGRGSIQSIGAALILWWWRPLPVDAPGKFGAVVVIPVVVVAFVCATRRRRGT
jgi:hypothetical protein